MSALNLFRPTITASEPVDLLAVFLDATSIDAMKSLIIDQAIANAHAQTGTIDDAIHLLRTLVRPPRQLLVDVSGSEMPLSDLARLADACAPSVSVVVIGERNDVGLYRSLLEVGVQDYVVKPITVEFLRRALSARDPSAPARTGKVIGFVGARGGVGATTIAVSLARHLSAETLRQVVYVDLDLHGGAAGAMLGLRTGTGLTELLQDPGAIDSPALDRALIAADDRLFVLASELAYEAEIALRPGALANLVNALKRRFHYVLLDLPRRNGRSLKEILDVSQNACIVADRSVYAARECARLIRFAEEHKGEPEISVLLNNPLEPVADRVHPQDFRRALGRAVVHELPYEPKSLARAENLGEPIGARTGREGFAAAIERLANCLTGRESAASLPWHTRLLKLRRTG
ncbi:CpaE family protein [Paraburkholderia phymatum]|uniref:CpaE family protein n=1 Tax=Paraburkholderia phymatum TaxID=148447 RepID=A0ACC6TV25_9BURK